MTDAKTGVMEMKGEVRFLNLICVIAAIAFLALAVLNAVFSGEFFTTDNLFITVVCLVMALMFAANPLLYLKSEGKLPIPFMKRSEKPASAVTGTGTAAFAKSPATPPLLDARGRAVPPDVKSMMANMKPKQQ
ncbi:MAG TPA: hypothetical protein VHR36_05150 [Pyrinomonadaceae bacterium]|jgi:hypothetical protein|nr:hypothetical protein [Pyrinomonadaceae bacterium]